MPVRTKRVVRRKRPRRYTRRKKVYRRRVVRPYTKVNRGMPERLFTKLRYCENFKVTVGTADALISIRTFQSSLYDPDNSVTGGHQPMWFDQYAAIYGRYRVYGIGYVITAQNQNADQGWFIGVRRDNSYIIGDVIMQAWMERRDTQVRMGSNRYGNSALQRIKGYMSVAKVRGLSHKEVAIDDNYSAFCTANPNLMAYLIVACQSGWAGTVLDVNVKLTYYCEFFDTVTPLQS